MNKKLIPFISLLLLLSCNAKEEFLTASNATADNKLIDIKGLVAGMRSKVGQCYASGSIYYRTQIYFFNVSYSYIGVSFYAFADKDDCEKFKYCSPDYQFDFFYQIDKALTSGDNRVKLELSRTLPEDPDTDYSNFVDYNNHFANYAAADRENWMLEIDNTKTSIMLPSGKDFFQDSSINANPASEEYDDFDILSCLL